MSYGGINLSAALSGFGRLVAAISPPEQIGQQASADAVDDNLGPWAPPQWGSPALTMITVPASAAPTSTATNRTYTTDVQGTGSEATIRTGVVAKASPTTYVFDAVFRVAHSRRLHPTEHPVLTGAVISDHAYLEPPRVELDIGMSDAMAAFSNGMWTVSPSKSLSAFQVLKQLQLNRTLVQLNTRLDNYENMLIIEVNAPDDVRTRHGLRCLITLQQMFAGVAQTLTSSARPQTTGSNSNLSVLQSQPIDPALLAQHLVPDDICAAYPTVPGAGSITSNSVSSLVIPE